MPASTAAAALPPWPIKLAHLFDSGLSTDAGNGHILRTQLLNALQGSAPVQVCLQVHLHSTCTGAWMLPTAVMP